jgi:hypothetical protein
MTYTDQSRAVAETSQRARSQRIRGCDPQFVLVSLGLNRGDQLYTDVNAARLYDDNVYKANAVGVGFFDANPIRHFDRSPKMGKHEFTISLRAAAADVRYGIGMNPNISAGCR